MKFRIGFAPEIKKMAWHSPRMLPMIRADEADGICLFPRLDLTTSKVPLSSSDLHILSIESDGQMLKDI